MKKLIYILFVLITIAFVVAAIAGFATGRINPEGKEWISFPGLVLLPVLAVNLCLFLMWCVFRSHWCWVPLAALFAGLGLFFKAIVGINGSDGSTASDSLLVRTEVPTTALDAIEAEEDEEYLEYLEAQYANYLLDEELSYSE
ncbi:MAG: hypothetical protein E7A71_09330 [Enterococcus faecium]|nr:hypothetical protein [Enterococcus faecium]